MLQKIRWLENRHERKNEKNMWCMETSSFYLMADLLEIPSIALLVVSDNSATGVALVGRNEEEKIAYDEGRKKILPEMLLKVVGY